MVVSNNAGHRTAKAEEIKMKREVIEKIHVYNENRVRAGSESTILCWDEAAIERGSSDITEWGTGTRVQLIAQANEVLAARDSRPGGAAMAYPHRAARAVLAYLS